MDCAKDELKVNVGYDRLIGDTHVEGHAKVFQHVDISIGIIDGYEQNGTWTYKPAPSVAAMQKHGLIHGYPDGSFRPGNPIAREEAASMILGMLNVQYTTDQIQH